MSALALSANTCKQATLRIVSGTGTLRQDKSSQPSQTRRPHSAPDSWRFCDVRLSFFTHVFQVSVHPDPSQQNVIVTGCSNKKASVSSANRKGGFNSCDPKGKLCRILGQHVQLSHPIVHCKRMAGRQYACWQRLKDNLQAVQWDSNTCTIVQDLIIPLV